MHLLCEVPAEVQGALDNRQLRESIDRFQHSVVGNLESGVDRGQLRE